jgi:hypothetical protein
LRTSRQAKALVDGRTSGQLQDSQTPWLS